jgi:hypothetical protein
VPEGASVKGSDSFWDKRAHRYDQGADAQFYARVIEITKRHVGPGDVVADGGDISTWADHDICMWRLHPRVR